MLPPDQSTFSRLMRCTLFNPKWVKMRPDSRETPLPFFGTFRKCRRVCLSVAVGRKADVGVGCVRSLKGDQIHSFGRIGIQ